MSRPFFFIKVTILNAAQGRYFACNIFFEIKICDAAEVTVVESLFGLIELVLFGHIPSDIFKLIVINDKGETTKSVRRTSELQDANKK
jgi:hypothetical protein